MHSKEITKFLNTQVKGINEAVKAGKLATSTEEELKERAKGFKAVNKEQKRLAAFEAAVLEIAEIKKATDLKAALLELLS